MLGAPHNTEISCEGRPSVSHADLVSCISLLSGRAVQPGYI